MLIHCSNQDYNQTFSRRTPNNREDRNHHSRAVRFSSVAENSACGILGQDSSGYANALRSMTAFTRGDAARDEMCGAQRLGHHAVDSEPLD